MKKLLALTLAALMVVAVFAGCQSGGTGSQAAQSGTAQSGAAQSGAAQAEPAQTGGDIRAWLASSPETIDPNMNSSMDGSTYIVHTFQGLMRYKWDGTGVEYGDAESYTVSDDGLTWTFKLRPDLKWSDGQPLTAKDYEYTWRRVCDPDVAAPYAGDMAVFIKNGIEAVDGAVAPDQIGVKAIDDTTFEVQLAGPCPFFEQIAVFPVLYPVRQDVVEADPMSWWTKPDTYIGNGPFKMTEFTLDSQMVIVPNENYYEVSNIVPNSITFKFLADENAALAALRAGEIDLANTIPPEELGALKNDGLYFPMPQLGTYYISFNTQKAPFDNPLVRKALTLAVDRQYLSETVMQGMYAPATSMVGPGFPDADGKDFRANGGDYISLDYEANKKLAQEALAEAGYPGGAGFPVVEYMYNTSAIHKPVSEVIAKSWEDVLGIKTNIAVQEWGVFLDSRRKGNFEIARNGWISDWMDPSSMLTIFVTDGGNNDGKYSNADFDKYMAESYATIDKTARMTSLHNAEKVLMDEWGCGPLMNYALNYMVSKSLKDWYSISLGYTMLHTAKLEG